VFPQTSRSKASVNPPLCESSATRRKRLRLALFVALMGGLAFGVARWMPSRTAGRVPVVAGKQEFANRRTTGNAEASMYPRLFFQKGVSFTAEYPDVYGSRGADRHLIELKKYGVNAIALVPYGFASERSVRICFNLGWEKDSGVKRLAGVAHRAGMRVLLKPQLFVRDGYPGSLEYSSAEERKEWFQQYRLFLEHYATLAARIHADLFCVGVELDKLSKYTSEWRDLIARIRELYPGPLVYAANFGDEFESVAFWDALDYIGMDEYYSLPDSLSTDEVVSKVAAVQARFQKPVIFTEVGFPSMEAANRNPWDESPRKVSLELQARCYEEIFRAFYEKPWFQGMYWWKVGTNGFGGPTDRSHTPWRKPAMEVVRQWYQKEER
jgi:Glycoside Hydrolase Family 113